MEYLFINRPGDIPIVMDLIAQFKANSKEELVARYNRAVEIGIIVSRDQAHIILALNVAFKFIFGKSPIKIENNILIRLTDKIELVASDWQYQNN